MLPSATVDWSGEEAPAWEAFIESFEWASQSPQDARAPAAPTPIIAMTQAATDKRTSDAHRRTPGVSETADEPVRSCEFSIFVGREFSPDEYACKTATTWSHEHIAYPVHKELQGFLLPKSETSVAAPATSAIQAKNCSTALAATGSPISLTACAATDSLEVTAFAYNGQSTVLFWPDYAFGRSPWKAVAVANWTPAFVVLKRMVLLLLFEGAAMSVASASCGDWLAHQEEPRPRRETRLARYYEELPSSFALERDRRDPGGQRPASCSSARCGSSPFPPSSPTPTDSLSGAAEKVAVAGAANPCDSAQRQAGIVWELGARPTKGFARRVEHPPRV